MNANIEATLRDLQKQKVKIEAAIASLRMLVHPNGSSQPKTINQAILDHLAKTGTPQTNNQIKEMLREAGLSTSSLLSLLSKRAKFKKDIVHKKRGVWALKK